MIVKPAVALSALMALESTYGFSPVFTHLSRTSTKQSNRFGGFMRIKHSNKGEAQKESEMRAEAAERRVAKLQAELGEGGDSDSDPSELKDKLEKLETQVKVKEDVIVKMKSEMDEMKKIKAEGEKSLSIINEKERLISNIKDAHEGKIETLTKGKNALQKENEELKRQVCEERANQNVDQTAEIEGLKIEIEELKKSKVEGNKALEEKDQLITDIKDSQRDEVKRLTEANETLEKVKTDLEKKVNENSDKNSDQSAEIAELRAEIEALKKENETLQKEMTELQNQVGKSVDGDAQIAKIAQLTKENDMLEKEKVYIQSQVESKFANENKLALNEIAKEKDELGTKMSKIQAQLAAFQKENDEKQHTLVQISKLNDDLSRQVHTLRQQLDSVGQNAPPGTAQAMPPPPMNRPGAVQTSMNGPGAAQNMPPPQMSDPSASEQRALNIEHKQDLDFIDGVDRSYIMKSDKRRKAPANLSFDSDAFLNSATLPTWRKRSEINRQNLEQQTGAKKTHTLNFDGKTTVNTNSGQLSRETGGPRGVDMRQTDVVGYIPVGQKKTHGRQATKGNTIPPPPEWRGQADAQRSTTTRGHAPRAPPQPQMPIDPPPEIPEPPKPNTTKVLDFDSSTMAGTRPIPRWHEEGGSKTFK